MNDQPHAVEIRAIVQRDYVDTVADAVVWKKTWRKISVGLRWAAYVCLFAQDVMGIAQLITDDKYWTFGYLTLSQVTKLLLHYSTHAAEESSARTALENTMLKKLGIDSVPDLMAQDARASSKSNTPNVSNRDAGGGGTAHVDVRPLSSASSSSAASVVIHAGDGVGAGAGAEA